MKRIKYLLLTVPILLMSCGGQQEEKGSDTDTTATATEEKAFELATEELTYSTDSVEMKGYLAYNKNASGKSPGILVVHEWWGHNEYARKRAEMLAELGYVAMAIDMYGSGRQADHPDQAGKFMNMVMSNFDAAKARFTRAMEELKANPNVDSEQIAAIGYCFGGSVVLSMANAGLDLDAVVAFHGGLQLPVMPEKGKVKAKVLVCNGAEDPFVKPEHVAAYTAAMDSAQAEYEYIAYEGAKHSFTSKAADSLGKKFELPLAYNAEADRQSWEEMKSLFNEVFEE